MNLHAIAIDEAREPFLASVWRKPKFKSYTTVTEQVWFAGVHSDIGGGYIDEQKRPELSPRPFALILAPNSAHQFLDPVFLELGVGAVVLLAAVAGDVVRTAEVVADARVRLRAGRRL